MAQPGPVFTAAEVLRAGLQAEAEGRIDYAVQFYRHLTNHHVQTPEAAEARIALQRITQRRSAEATQTATAASQRGPMAVAPQAPPEGQRGPAGGAVVLPQAGAPPSLAVTNAAPAEAVRLPAPERRYLIGRVMATGLQVLGWLMAALGIAMLGLGVVIGGSLPFVGSPFITGPGLALLGVLLVFWGQLARAVFDAANAARDIVAIERAKSGRHHR